MKPYYLCTPYTKFAGGTDAAYLAAAKLVADLLKHGVLDVFSPITYSHTIAKFLGPDFIALEKWESIDRWAIENSRGILVGELEGWRESAGIAKETEYARSILIPVWYVDPKTLDIRHQPHDL